MITNEIREKIVKAIKERRANFTSDRRMAIFLGIDPTQFSRIKSGNHDNLLSDARWIIIARKLDIQIGERAELVAAKTPVFQFVTSQLQSCKEYSLSGLLCDSADIGKSFAAKIFAKDNSNVAYIDCSQHKTRQRLVRAISREFGLSSTGRYIDVYEDLVFYLRSGVMPLVILDEAGDLDYPAFLELKALWNATEHCCGWYMIGADGLRAKIDSNVSRKKVGYTEIFSRYGSRYQKISPDGRDDADRFKRKQVSMIAKVNGVDDPQALYARTQGSLRRIYIEIQKIKAAGNGE
jgi:hypothetical protein